MGQSCITSLYACPASYIRVQLIFEGLNCSYFPRSFPSIIIKKYARLIRVVVSKPFNASFADGKFPEIL